MKRDTTSAEFFDAMYRRDSDPWNFTSSEYELGRYEDTVAVLSGRSFQRAFEPGCSIGVLTARLALICDRVEAIDISKIAIEQAQARCRHFPHVSIRSGELPQAMPPGKFELIVFSEIGYYFDEQKLTEIGGRFIRQMSPKGWLLATHWLGSSDDHLLSGDQVHETLKRLPGLQLIHAERHPKFRIECWERL